MDIVYAAHTESGTFMLDGTGVCRWAVAPPGKTHAKVPDRIVGAQYVATLDVSAPGALVPLPKPGCPMLFASTDENGHVTLVRTPPVQRFEDKRRPSAAPPRCLDPSRTLEDMTPINALPSARPASTPPLPLVRPAAAPLPPFRPVGMLPKLPPPPRPAMPSISPPTGARPPTHSTMRPAPMAAAPQRSSMSSIPPARTTDLSFPPSPDSSMSAPTNGIPSRSVPVRIRSTNESLRRMARGR